MPHDFRVLPSSTTPRPAWRPLSPAYLQGHYNNTHTQQQHTHNKQHDPRTQHVPQTQHAPHTHQPHLFQRIKFNVSLWPAGLVDKLRSALLAARQQWLSERLNAKPTFVGPALYTQKALDARVQRAGDPHLGTYCVNCLAPTARYNACPMKVPCVVRYLLKNDKFPGLHRFTTSCTAGRARPCTPQQWLQTDTD